MAKAPVSEAKRTIALPRELSPTGLCTIHMLQDEPGSEDHNLRMVRAVIPAVPFGHVQFK